MISSNCGTGTVRARRMTAASLRSVWNMRASWWVAIVGRPVARMFQVDGAAELLRLCVAPSAPLGANSKLYSRCKRIWQLMGGTKLHTYTLSKESGASMRGAGLKEPAAKVAKAQWNRTARPRDERAIYEEPKVRWTETLPEVAA